ncbi:MAG TPA: aspartate kinase [Chitinophagaceae bacterium]|nr:aspartate kinase [Chitinophagaceae bacterium]
MKVFKFGGASINTAERIEKLIPIFQSYPNEKILVIVSAMGKTTNALEKVTREFYKGEKEQALQLFEGVKQAHINLANELLSEPVNGIKDFFTEVEWLIHDKPIRSYDYYYDQIVCAGEMLSSSIVSSFLNENKIKNILVDVRDIIRTDDNFRDANVDINFTQNKINDIIKPLFNDANIVITQGFIGSTDENESTTLGREGSDYTAALFANMLNAESLTIWKDVEGVLNADPKEFTDATFIAALSYDEVIEMAFYGAQVIHPKTIKPLQNKNIPLHVRCFLKPDAPGTIISNKYLHDLPPIIVLKYNQALINLSSKDFSFVGEKPMSRLYEIFAELKIKPTLTQNGAISILICMDENKEKNEKLALLASEIFDVQLERGLTLLTIRHYTIPVINMLTKMKNIVLEQKTKTTIQLLMKDAEPKDAN